MNHLVIDSAVIQEKQGIRARKIPQGEILEFIIAWWPDWCPMYAVVNQYKSDKAKRELFTGRYYYFYGYLKYNKAVTPPRMQMEITEWQELARQKTTAFTGDPARIQDENKPKFIRKAPQEDMMH